MSIDLSAAITTFVTESKELLQDMEDGLLELESDLSKEQKSEVINSIFRAIHTIKGSAGIFGFKNVVDLTHIIETTLDEIRLGEIILDNKLITALLSSRDVVETLVILSAQETEVDPATLHKAQDLQNTFKEYLAPEPPSHHPDALQNRENLAQSAGNTRWHILFTPNENVYRDGLDPFAFIFFLSKEVTELQVDTYTGSLESTDAFDPESNYLAFHLCFDSDKSESEIADIFDFIKTEAVLGIFPPNAAFEQFKTACHEFSNINYLIEKIKKCHSIETHVLDAIAQNKATISEAIPTSVEQDKSKQPPPKLHQSKTLRVEALKLDRLIDQVGEMVITGARTNLLAHETGNETLIEAMALLERLVENIRDSSLKLRMVQIGETFNKFKRVVRDISQELGKEVELTIEGADTELDKTFVEKVSDPLMHIIRNAIDHGIESPQERIISGKPTTGNLKLRAYHDSGSIVIEISDDGKGLNKTKILQRAIEKGLVAQEHSLPEKEINLLIFAPGFSTADSVTNISGRGVGMDVVKRNIESLRGSVEVESEPDKGSTILIRLPLTLSIIDGFMFSVHNDNYVIPLDTVVECLELHEVVAEQDIQDKSYINLRTEVLPFIRLRSLFGVEERIAHTRESLVIVQFGTLRAGLVVDSLKGEFQTVVKPLGRLFEGLKCISGATILGSGDVAIILDVSALIKSAIAVYETLEFKQ
ncbi:two-component system, chemotaxis family, sensor kinase CheA [Pseudoalteromonas citrea]|uniref:Chemotaxis protein CheA n=2 Tax=Pseudoalteromonas citrea TaxID=43655 RepID=A0AAD4AKD6_9GAMM|nr:chemotaxis protein CheA [Pseudoalteromonas citrea]KAF7773820.1 two-component system, chemotaxis family, sensor kinase CheA [Pseudoalteromonas citrea]